MQKLERAEEEIRELPTEEELLRPASGPPVSIANLPKETVLPLDLDVQVVDDPSDETENKGQDR
jgi:hypothetical protein